MSGIHVLSESFKSGSKLEKISTTKGKDVSDSPKSAAAAFAAMLSGSINLKADPKGQNSKTGQESDEKQSTSDLVLNVQDPNEQANIPGYGNFAFSNLFQVALQSDLPAGKEANSGNDASQGTGVALLKLVSLVSDGVSAQSGMTELDKYKQVIAELLVALSGEITDKSPNGTTIGATSASPKDLSQDVAKILQGWMTVTEDATKNGDPALKAKVATLLAAVNTKLGQEKVGPEGATTVQGTKASSEPFQMPKGTDITPLANQVKDTSLLTNVQQKSEGTSTQKGESTRSAELPGVKDVQIQNPSAGIGLANNVVVANVADGKTVAVPVWEQLSSVIREQVMNRSQDLKQLDIQLHPADLGKIQIGLRWENGQVHLQVQASIAATGQLLQNQLPDLRQALVNHGVNCGMLHMGQGGEQGQNSQGDQSRRTFNQKTHLNEDEDIIPRSNPLSHGWDEINRINVTA